MLFDYGECGVWACLDCGLFVVWFVVFWLCDVLFCSVCLLAVVGLVRYCFDLVGLYVCCSGGLMDSALGLLSLLWVALCGGALLLLLFVSVVLLVVVSYWCL